MVQTYGDTNRPESGLRHFTGVFDASHASEHYAVRPQTRPKSWKQQCMNQSIAIRQDIR